MSPSDYKMKKVQVEMEEKNYTASGGGLFADCRIDPF